MRSDADRLRDVIEAIERIERHSGIAKKTFESDELIQVWMVHNLQIIGEAVAGLSEEFRRQRPEIPWRSIAATRNLIVHAYFRVDLDEVWSIITGDLPDLEEKITAMLES